MKIEKSGSTVLNLPGVGTTMQTFRQWLYLYQRRIICLVQSWANITSLCGYASPSLSISEELP